MTELGDKLALRDRCTEEGRQARAAGLAQFENPYFHVDQHEERSAWANGWWEVTEEEDPLVFTPLSKQFKPTEERLNSHHCGNLSNKMLVAR